MRKDKAHGTGYERVPTAERRRLRRLYEVKTPEILDDTFSH